MTVETIEKPHRNGAFLRANGRMNLAGGEEGSQVTGAFRRAELAERLGFDLADALAGDVELLADLFERMFALAADSETKPNHLFFLW